MTYFIDDHKPRSSESYASEKREYYVYLALMFEATLPLDCLTWVLSAERRMELPASGTIKSAWSQTQIITPRIFSA